MKKLITFIVLSAMLFGIIPYAVIADNTTKTVPFDDVKESDWFYKAIEFAYNDGIFKGTNESGTEFSPNRNMTRAEFATTLFRISGANEEAFLGDTGFSDVASGKWMSAAVKWASEMGYVKGTGQNKFDPNGTLDRQQLATMLYRFTSHSLDTSEVDEKALDNFDDGNTTASWALEAMTWAVSVKVINGNDKNLLIPEVYATRAQVAQILMNFDSLYEGTDSTGLMNRDLVFSINNQKGTEAKNIIIMIGDGMGYNIVDYTEYLYKDQLYQGQLAMNYIAQQSCQTTYSADAVITDSAASSTALATGYKTGNEIVGLDTTLEIEYKNILERSAENGKSTGVVVTKWVTDATPADFTAHNYSRFNFDYTAKQQMEKLKNGTLDLLLGGGNSYFHNETTEPVLETAIENGSFNFTNSFEEAKSMATPILGLFDEEEIDTFDQSLPTIADMTSLALEKLSKDENGFFLMVEGSQIDSYAGDDIEKSAHETFRFDQAVAVVLNFIKDNPDTVLIVTADHETGGLIIPEELNDSNAKDSFYIYSGHSCRNVPIFAYGYGVEALQGTIENVEIGIFMASLLGEETGARSTNYNLLSKTDDADKNAFSLNYEFAKVESNGVLFDFEFDYISTDKSKIYFPINEFNTDLSGVKNARAIHIEYTNVGDKYCSLPCIRIGDDIIDPHLEYLKEGEHALVTYVLPISIWQDFAFANVSEIELFIAEPYFDYDPMESHLLIGDITLTNRNLEF